MVFGTRPEAIKMAPVFVELVKQSDVFDVRVCVTAQHRQMLDQVLNIFNIAPHYDLNLMTTSQTLHQITIGVLDSMRNVFADFKPNYCLVHGDTTTTFATSLAAYYDRIAVGHVEAGLRTRNIYSPFPEEINRQLTTRIATLHFAPTESARQNLLSEGVSENSVWVTGNTVIDALIAVAAKFRDDYTRQKYLICALAKAGYSIRENRIILITGHRRENFGEGFHQICRALKKLALQNKNIDFVYPVHLNPNVREPVFKLLAGIQNIYLIQPLDYEPFIFLMDHAYLILTDSGGIQEEAPSLGKPVLVMREVTERPEAVDAGTVKLVGSSEEQIIASVLELINDENIYLKMAQAINPYGDGTASEIITNIIMEL